MMNQTAMDTEDHEPERGNGGEETNDDGNRPITNDDGGEDVPELLRCGELKRKVKVCLWTLQSEDGDTIRSVKTVHQWLGERGMAPSRATVGTALNELVDDEAVSVERIDRDDSRLSKAGGKPPREFSVPEEFRADAIDAIAWYHDQLGLGPFDFWDADEVHEHFLAKNRLRSTGDDDSGNAAQRRTADRMFFRGGR
jgi:hypothetical protein